jgi:hypothetical protein
MASEDKYADFAWECVRLAELTDNQELRSHLQAFALQRVAGTATQRDDQLNVIEFP